MTSPASVLIGDDKPAVRGLMSRWVAWLGLRPGTASSADQALATLRLHHDDMAVIDAMMPGHDGVPPAGELQREHAHCAVSVATAATELAGGDAQQHPIADVLIKPFQRERLALAVDRGWPWRKQALEAVHWHPMLSIELHDRAARISHTLDARAVAGASEADALAALAFEGMPDVAAHGERVARYAHSVAREVGVDRALGAHVEIAARFHDIGKMAMPRALISKPFPLTPGERAIMRRHVDIGAEILDATRSLAFAAPAVRASHEWFGGGGYPRGSAGITIPLVSRIIAVADAYDAMTQNRAYRIRLDSSDAIAELLRCSPAQFDPEIVAAFLAVLGRH